MPNPETQQICTYPGCLELIFNFLLLNFPQIHSAKPLGKDSVCGDQKGVMPLFHVPPGEGGKHV